jgi:Ni,Fe-hydrogenase maturation factor
MDDLSAACVSTHNSSLALLSKVLLAEGVSDVFLLGIQPKQTSFGSPCSREVLAAVEEVVAALLAWAVGWGQVEVSMAGQETHQAAD